MVLRAPICRSGLAAVNLVDEGMVRRVRGVAWSARSSPASTGRMVDGARGVLNALLADVYIFTDAMGGALCKGWQ